MKWWDCLDMYWEQEEERSFGQNIMICWKQETDDFLFTINVKIFVKRFFVTLQLQTHLFPHFLVIVLAAVSNAGQLKLALRFTNSERLDLRPVN